MFQKLPAPGILSAPNLNNFFNLSEKIFKKSNYLLMYRLLPNQTNINALGGQCVDNINFEASSYRFIRYSFIRPHSLTKNLIPYWTRFMFRGKAFRLRYYKRLNRFIFNLGYSHVSKLWLSSQFLGARKPRPRERTRQRYAIFSHSLRQILQLRLESKQVKPYNVYTQRGLRLRSQGIGRRFGKISQHISSLH